MGSKLRISSIEDDPKDAELIQDLLEAENIACEVTRVDTQAALMAFLEQGGIDLILADCSLPTFDGISALKVATQICPDVPFIFVSGTLGEEVAIGSSGMPQLSLLPVEQQIPPLRCTPVPRQTGAGGMTIWLKTR